MIKTSLVMALDFEKKKDVKPEQFSYRRGEQWFVCHCGPGYSNTFRITAFDDEGLKKLLAAEDKEESTPRPATERSTSDGTV